MINCNDIGVGPTIDQPDVWHPFVNINGNQYSMFGIINALVDIKLERYLEDHGLTPEKDTFDTLKYTKEELKLREIAKELL